MIQRKAKKQQPYKAWSILLQWGKNKLPDPPYGNQIFPRITSTIAGVGRSHRPLCSGAKKKLAVSSKDKRFMESKVVIPRDYNFDKGLTLKN